MFYAVSIHGYQGIKTCIATKYSLEKCKILFKWSRSPQDSLPHHFSSDCGAPHHLQTSRTEIQLAKLTMIPEFPHPRRDVACSSGRSRAEDRDSNFPSLLTWAEAADSGSVGKGLLLNFILGHGCLELPVVISLSFLPGMFGTGLSCLSPT
jgi:hypothetical protein